MIWNIAQILLHDVIEIRKNLHVDLLNLAQNIVFLIPYYLNQRKFASIIKKIEMKYHCFQDVGIRNMMPFTRNGKPINLRKVHSMIVM